MERSPEKMRHDSNVAVLLIRRHVTVRLQPLHRQGQHLEQDLHTSPTPFHHHNDTPEAPTAIAQTDRGIAQLSRVGPAASVSRRKSSYSGYRTYRVCILYYLQKIVGGYGYIREVCVGRMVECGGGMTNGGVTHCSTKVWYGVVWLCVNGRTEKNPKNDNTNTLEALPIGHQELYSKHRIASASRANSKQLFEKRSKGHLLSKCIIYHGMYHIWFIFYTCQLTGLTHTQIHLCIHASWAELNVTRGRFSLTSSQG